MRENLELIGLDPERIEAVAAAREGLGYARLGLGREGEGDGLKNRIAATSHLRHAAGSWLLLDEIERSQAIFRAAADELSEVGQPLGILLRALAERDREVSWMDSHWIHPEAAEVAGASAVFLLLNRAVLDREQFGEMVEPLRRTLEDRSSWPVGRLGLPVRAYLDLVDLLRAQEAADATSLADVLRPFVMSFGAALAEARRDTYHWRYLRTSFHPVEPEVAGVIILVARSIGLDYAGMVQKALVRIPTGREVQALLGGFLDVA